MYREIISETTNTQQNKYVVKGKSQPIVLTSYVVTT